MSRRLVLAGLSLLGTALAAVLVYWEADPNGATTEAVLVLTVLVGGLLGLLCLVGAAFAGPPAWWGGEDVGARITDLWWLWTAGVLFLIGYGIWAWPFATEDTGLDELNVASLVIGVVCAAGAVRAGWLGLSLALGVIGGLLLWINLAEASFLLAHGVLAFALLALAATAQQTRSA